MTHARAEPQPSKRRRDPKGTRERLVRAALELFTSQGFHASTTPQIAARAGIAEGTIYRHFQSKEHLLNELYRAAVRMLTNAVAEAPNDLPCQQRLSHIASAWRTLADRNPPLIKLVFERDIAPQLDAKSRDSFRHFRRELETVLATGKSAGDVRASMARTGARPQTASRTRAVTTRGRLNRGRAP